MATIFWGKKTAMFIYAGYVLLYILAMFGFVFDILGNNIDFTEYMRQPSAWIAVILVVSVQAIIFIFVLDNYNHKIETLQTALEYRAEHDYLTDLYSHQKIDQMIGDKIMYKEPFTFFFLDLNGFKQINDQYGHESGDIVLKVIAHRLREIYHECVVSRYGGDEFTIISNYTDKKRIINQCEKTVKAINLPILCHNGEVSLGVSIGVSIYPETGSTMHDILTSADHAMYEAKNNKDIAFKISEKTK